MKFNIFYVLFVFSILFILGSCSSGQNNKSTAQKEKISFTNIKYLDTIQNTKPAEGIPEVDVDYWMKTVFKGIKGVKDGKGYLESKDSENNNEYLKNEYNQKPKILEHFIIASQIYYYNVNREPHAIIFLYHYNEIPDYVRDFSYTQEKSYEHENTTMSIIELEFKENRWVLIKHYEDLKNCLSQNHSQVSFVALGWNFELYTPKFLSLENEHNFILTEDNFNSFYLKDLFTAKLFSIGNFKNPAISWENLNEFSFKDFDSSLTETLVNSMLEFQGLKPYKKTENIKFFLDKGILHAEITQDGFIHDREKDKMIPQNSKTYYRYSEEKKIFTKLE